MLIPNGAKTRFSNGPPTRYLVKRGFQVSKMATF